MRAPSVLGEQQYTGVQLDEFMLKVNCSLKYNIFLTIFALKFPQDLDELINFNCSGCSE